MKHLENFESYNESKSDMDMKKINKEIKDKKSEIEKLEVKHSDMKKPSAHASILKQDILKLEKEVETLEKELNKLENTSENFDYKEEMGEKSSVQIGDIVDIDMSKILGIAVYPGQTAYDVKITNIVNEWPNTDMVEFEMDGETYKAPMSAVRN